MDRGLYSGVAAMNANERGLDSIATNLANLSVNGYKRRSTASDNFDAMLRGKLERQIGTHVGVDFSQGPLRHTGNEWDLALSGSGFFVVEGQAGELYTRNGQFHIDDRGTLLTLEGHPVAWEEARGVVDAQGVDPQVDGEGVVWQGETRVGQLKLVDFADPAGLQAVGDGYFRAPKDVRQVARAAEVVQMTLEGANVSAVDEMVAMVSLQRSYESATRLLTTIDQTYRRLVAQR